MVSDKGFNKRKRQKIYQALEEGFDLEEIELSTVESELETRNNGEYLAAVFNDIDKFLEETRSEDRMELKNLLDVEKTGKKVGGEIFSFFKTPYSEVLLVKDEPLREVLNPDLNSLNLSSEFGEKYGDIVHQMKTDFEKELERLSGLGSINYRSFDVLKWLRDKEASGFDVENLDYRKVREWFKSEIGTQTRSKTLERLEEVGRRVCQELYQEITGREKRELSEAEEWAVRDWFIYDRTGQDWAKDIIEQNLKDEDILSEKPGLIQDLTQKGHNPEILQSGIGSKSYNTNSAGKLFLRAAEPVEYSLQGPRFKNCRYNSWHAPEGALRGFGNSRDPENVLIYVEK